MSLAGQLFMQKRMTDLRNNKRVSDGYDGIVPRDMALSVVPIGQTYTPIKDPRLSFGKKCKLTDDQVIWSHVWIYSKQEGVKANEEDCKFIPEK